MAQEQLPRTYEDRIKALEREVAALRKATPLRSASIGAGGVRIYDGGGIDIDDGGTISVKDANGNVIALIGEVEPGVRGMRYFRSDGSRSLDIRDYPDPDGNTGTAVLYDQAGNGILWDDSRSGVGFGSPYWAFQMTPIRGSSWEATTSTAFEALLYGYPRKWSAKFAVVFSITCDGGTNGEARVMANGVQVGATASVIGSAVTQSTVVFDAEGDWGDYNGVVIEARTTSGAGSVRVNAEVLETRQQPPA